MVVLSKTTSTTCMACMRHAGLFSSITSKTNPDTHTHTHCAKGEGSWCWYNRQLHDGIESPVRGHHSTPLPKADQQGSAEEVSPKSHLECQLVVEPRYLDEGPESSIRRCRDDSQCSSMRGRGVEQRKPVSLRCDG